MISSPSDCKTLTDLIEVQATARAAKIGYRYLRTGDISGGWDELTFAELRNRARAIGSLLQRAEARGERVLLLFPPGLEFICGFFGCSYGGAIPVPAYPPDPSRLERTLPRLLAIAADCDATFVLTTKAIAAMSGAVAALAPGLARLRWIAVDDDTNRGDLSPEGTTRGAPDPVAFLQYTSGSTGTPRGVVVSHDNVLHNVRCIHQVCELDADARPVSWLPTYHDMGLIGGLFYPLYLGCTSTLFSPLAFLQRPARWLEAMSHFQATGSCAPNFAYDLCAHKIKAAERETLDLSHWSLALTGAEPVRAETLDRFAAAFAPCGFRREAFLPCYGLAEATLFVTAGRKHQGATAIRTETAKPMVSCGHPRDAEVLIVDPESHRRCGPGEIGEIWVRSPSVAKGYWNRPDETVHTFGGRLESGEGPFLCTGDLGFLREGELYVAGRLKDLIIIRGRNHYPQDIEQTVEASHPAVRKSCVAAFSIAEDGEERLAIVAEVDDASDERGWQIVETIRTWVSAEHAIQVHTIALLKPRTIPKTSSGKIQRGACREGLLAGALSTLLCWSYQPGRPSRPEVEAWLVAQVALRTGLDPRRIDTTLPLSTCGLDSKGLLELSGEIASRFGRECPPTLLYTHPTIDALSCHLSGEPGPVLATTVAPIPPSAPAPASALHAEADDLAGAVAIVGIGCRYPKAKGLDEYWSLLRHGVDAITEVSDDRWDAAQLYDADPLAPGKTTSRWGGFLDDIAPFDAPFFGISSAETCHMDPQQRVLLEVTWEALEDAGIIPAALAGSNTAVFVGISTSDYAHLQMKNRERIDSPYASTGSLLSIAANRLSYEFDLRGPSLAIDTACSSSLVAIHYACEAVRHGAATIAIAGGVNLLLSPESTILVSKIGGLSPDGRCHAFDASANGYVRSEGAGVVILKPLEAALADGDRVYAVIRGSAVSQDGRSSGLTVPSPTAQEALLRTAYTNARISPARVHYVEAHGTGTAIGDPLEAAALGAVVGTGRATESRCAIGSVKTNIGHLEAAAGVAGLTKVVLALRNRMLPPSLHFVAPNPHIPFSALGLYVQRELTPWPAQDGPRVAGVSSFGIGGTNAHVVLQEMPDAELHRPGRDAAPDPAEPQRPHLLVLSARTPAALTSMARAYDEYLAHAPAPLSAITQTAALRRTHHEHRVAVVGSSIDSVRDKLACFARGEHAAGVFHGQVRGRNRRRLAFVLSGQGGQHPGMARELYRSESVFREQLERCDRAMRPHLGWSLCEQLLSSSDTAQTALERDDVIQPLVFAVQIGLAALLRSWGIEPDAVVGHSQGEIAAAAIAGALPLEAAAQVICLRASLVRTVGGRGGMALVGLSWEEAARVLREYDGRLWLSADNGPGWSVVSGDPLALDELGSTLTKRDVFCRRIKVSYASHSPMMTCAAEALGAVLGGIRPASESVPFYSTVCAGPLPGNELAGGYWSRNLREPVRFRPTIQRMLADGYDSFIELSPHPTLMPTLQQMVGDRGTVIPSLAKDQNDRDAVIGLLAGLYAAGHPVDLRCLHPDPATVVSLPSYPWQRTRYWLNDRDAAVQPASATAAADAPATAAASLSDVIATVWQKLLRVTSFSSHDSFFALGGDSLAATAMIQELRVALRREIPLRAIYDHPTIAQLAEALNNETITSSAPAVPLLRSALQQFPLSFQQERAFRHFLAQPEDTSHIIPWHLRVTGPLDIPLLARSLNVLTERHEALRARCSAEDGVYGQWIAPHVPFDLPVHELSDLSPVEQASAVKAILTKLESAIDLCTSNPFRMHVLKLGPESHILAAVFHHIAVDFRSLQLFQEELQSVYGCNGLDSHPANDLRYVDFAAWQRKVLDEPVLREQLEYWRRRLEGAPRPSRLPFVPRQRTSSSVELHDFVIEGDLIDRLRATSQATASSNRVILIATFAAILASYTGSDHVTVPILAANRRHHALRNVVGYFAHTELVSILLQHDRSIRDYLHAVRDAVLLAHEEQIVPALHYYALRQEASPFRNVLNYLPGGGGAENLGMATLTRYPAARPLMNNLVQYDVHLMALDKATALECRIYYASDIDRASIEELSKAFCSVLSRICDELDAPLKSVLTSAAPTIVPPRLQGVANGYR